MLKTIVTEGDSKQIPIELSLESMRKFLTSYEDLRNHEKRLASEGIPVKLISKCKRVYGPLIKMFALRSEATEFRRRNNSLFHKNGERERSSSPRAGSVKRILKRDQETQIEFEHIDRGTLV